MLLFGRGFFFYFSFSWHHSTLLQTHWASVALKSCPVWFVFVYVLTACVFVTRDTVRHPRRFVFGKFVRKPNCSWSEAFVNRGLTVYHSVSGWVDGAIPLPPPSPHVYKACTSTRWRNKMVSVFSVFPPFPSKCRWRGESKDLVHGVRQAVGLNSTVPLDLRGRVRSRTEVNKKTIP